MKLRFQKVRDWFAWCLVVYGPEWVHDPNTKFGAWCLSAAGNWAYRDYSAEL